jgi:hypothetical protein
MDFGRSLEQTLYVARVFAVGRETPIVMGLNDGSDETQVKAAQLAEQVLGGILLRFELWIRQSDRYYLSIVVGNDYNRMKSYRFSYDRNGLENEPPFRHTAR